MMLYKELFLQGLDFNCYVDQGSPPEIQAVIKVKEQLDDKQTISKTTLDRLMTLSGEVNLLIAGETPCPDCQLNMTAAQLMCEYQPKINIAVISKRCAEEKLKAVLKLDDIKIPLILILDQNYQLKGLFIERPAAVFEVDDFAAIKDAYFAGDYLNHTVNEILDKLLYQVIAC